MFCVACTTWFTPWVFKYTLKCPFFLMLHNRLITSVRFWASAFFCSWRWCPWFKISACKKLAEVLGSNLLLCRSNKCKLMHTIMKKPHKQFLHAIMVLLWGFFKPSFKKLKISYACCLYICSSSIIEMISRKYMFCIPQIFRITSTELDCLKRTFIISNQSEPNALTVQVGIILCIFWKQQKFKSSMSIVFFHYFHLHIFCLERLIKH